jgi:membrane fusion protein (multidrug efflux system)
MLCAVIICVGIIARIGYHLLSEAIPTTNKAVVEGYTYPISSSIDGTIAGILVSNCQYVRAGDLLVEIDKRDLEAKLAAASCDFVQAKTMLPEIETQLSKAQAELATAESKMSHRDNQLTEAISDYESISKPGTKQGISTLLFSRTKREYEVARSEVLRARTTLMSASDRVQEVQAQRNQNFLTMHATETIVRQMEAQLSLTHIYAPANGHVVFDKTNFAHRLSAGEPFFKLVGDDPWVIANFNENQLKHIRVGQSATIRIEALKQRTFHGEVVNIAPVAHGSGGPLALPLSLFGLIGIAHTVPVKVAFDSESVLGLAEHIDPGLNSFVEMDAR